MSSTSFIFGTVGAPLSTPNKPGGSVGAIIRSAEIGLHCLELGWVRAVSISEASCAQIKATAQSQGVSISVHASYYINLNADDEEWPKARKRLMDAAYYGYLAGATDIIFHPGSYFGHPPAEVLPRCIERLAGCVADLRLVGNPVILRPEIMGKAALLGSLEDTLEMSRVLAGVLPCLDFAHLHARTGNGSMNTYAEWTSVLEAFRNILGESALQQIHIHLSGIAYGPKGEKEHLPLEKADLDLLAILQALKDYNCRGRILCESPIMEEDALVIMNKWTELADN
jgi:deoxyribonuclease IV